MAQAGVVGVDVIGMVIAAGTDGADNRNEIVGNQGIQNFSVDLCHLSYIANILTFGELLAHPEQASIFSADANSLDTDFFHHGNETFVDLI